MPPKVKITKDDIIKTAFSLVRERGESTLNARLLAESLSCSTQPIFSNFDSMEALKCELRAFAYEHYLSFLEREAERGEFNKYKSFGRAYIRFAEEERELFKLLFMRDRRGEDLSPTPDFSESVEMIMKANGFSREIANLIHLENWACVHGIATMIVTSFLKLDDELVSKILSDVHLGVCARYREAK